MSANSLANQDPATDDDGVRFGFGANWADYVKHHFSDERVDIARRHLLEVLKLPDLRGRSFLDIGCGSGLHSLAAFRAGAAAITSFDYDPQSVATTRQLHALSYRPATWQIMQGSVLDDGFIAALPKSDIVYSWGVLHHTGSMWKAVENAARCLHESSVFYIALYSSDAVTDPPPSYWLRVKREYNESGLLARRWMEWQYAWKYSIRNDLVNGRNPLARIREYKRARGMSYWHDVRDWLGGYPMEYAGHTETEVFCRERLGLELVMVKAGEANTEYVFRRQGGRTYWDEVLARFPLLDVPGPFTSAGGFAWQCDLAGTGREFGSPDALMLYENGVPIGWPKQGRGEIIRWGRGRYRVDQQTLTFSAMDNSDPNLSGHRYQARADFA